MSDDVKFTKKNMPSSMPEETTIETEQQGGGEHRQVIKVAESALPDGAATSAKQATLTNLVATAVKQTNGTQKTQIVNSAGDVVGIETHNSPAVKALMVMPISNDLTFHVHMRLQNVTADIYAMVVDISDTANWPHTGGTVIHIDHIAVNINPNTSFFGDIIIGFLTNVGASDGDFNIIEGWHMERQSLEITASEHYAPESIICSTAKWFGPTETNVAALDTGTNLYGPDEATSYPSGDGDLVLFVDFTAGAVDIGMTVGYHTE